VRIVAALVAICALSQTAVAEMPECRSISDPSARLACYDKTNPTAAARPPALQAAPARKADTTDRYVDKIGAEDAVMNAQLKNICRGC
jgi:hypothetical protein